MAEIGYSNRQTFLCIDIRTETKVFSKHSLDWRKSYGGVVSYEITCKNCGGDFTVNPYGNNGQCSKPIYTYLNRPEWPEEDYPICSESVRIKSIERLKLRMLAFVKKFQKHNLYDNFISGTTSIASAAYHQLVSEGKLLIVKNSVAKYSHEQYKIILSQK